MKNRMSCIKRNRICLMGVASLFSAILLLSACTDSKYDVVDKFPVDKQLKGERVTKLDSCFACYGVTYNDGYYVFTQKGNYSFRIFDTSFNEINQICVRGNGENEWLAPYATGQFDTYNGQKSFYVLERPMHTLRLCTLSDGNRVDVEDFSGKDIADLRYVFCTGDKTYIGSQDNDGRKLFTYDAKTKTLTEFEHEGVETDECKIGKQDLLQTLATYSPEKHRLAVTYFSFPLLVMRDSDGNVVKTVRIGEDWPHYTDKNFEDANMWIIGVSSDKDNVYLLYDDPALPKEMSVLAFDWEGKPVARYHIARAMAFAVNNDNHTILTINEDESNGMCSIYNY